MLKYIILVLFNIQILKIVDAKFYSVAIARDRLVQDLFVNYNPASKPAEKGKTIEVSVYIELQHFDFREEDGAFNIVGFLNAEWCDPKLKWNPKDYNNLTLIPVHQKLVWTPDLEMYNNAPDRFLRMHRKGYVALNSTGVITWSDNIELTIFCSTNMKHWPNDEHRCHLTLGSWTYDGYDLDITNNPNTSLGFNDDHIKNMQFEITNYSAEHVTSSYEGYEEPYITMKYLIEFKRRSGYSKIFYAPVYTVILLTLVALAMKPNRGEKIILNGINFVVIIFQLLHFARSVGKFARSTPLIVSFYSGCLVLTTFAHLLCVFSLWTSRSRYKGHQLPVFISNFLQGPIAYYILPSKRKTFKTAISESQFEDVKLNDCSSLIPSDISKCEWIQLAVLFERIGIIVFSFVYLLLASTCLT